jgi:2-phospho-L-lactate guanylyltransferase
MSRVLAVPVKDLENAKQRLVPVLSPEERRALAAAMLEDVLAAVASARVDELWIVTRDAAVGEMARRSGAIVVGEAENRGHTAAVTAAQARALAAGVHVFATVPGDVPCVSPAEIDALLDAAGRETETDAARRTPAVVLAASRSGLGTNGVALSPPDAIAVRFGEPSFTDHVAAARARGIEPRLLSLPGLGLDVDGPDDLNALLAEGADTRSARLVASWKATARAASPAGGTAALHRIGDRHP